MQLYKTIKCIYYKHSTTLCKIHTKCSLSVIHGQNSDSHLMYHTTYSRTKDKVTGTMAKQWLSNDGLSIQTTVQTNLTTVAFQTLFVSKSLHVVYKLKVRESNTTGRTLWICTSKSTSRFYLVLHTCLISGLRSSWYSTRLAVLLRILLPLGVLCRKRPNSAPLMLSWRCPSLSPSLFKGILPSMSWIVEAREPWR